jgi:hypothetical protein
VTHEAVISEDELVIAIIGHRPINKGEQKKIDGLISASSACQST